ncbi:thiamine pyrophosphate-dependent enzyme, partial [Verrucomicrobium sp. BvORR106]|uniref:thiamine pyrophosphate-dependent enzyme n=1 Tax=Verrucomicrobium sp. BvORR106 TaxID=1403819 RepID=UPI00056E3E47
VDRAKGYGVEGYEVDGKDLLACLQVFQHAISRARAGHGPQMVVGSLLRLGGHGEHDDASYIPDTVKHSEHGRDCLHLAEECALERGWATKAELLTLRENSQKEVDRALAQTSREPTPDPYKESWRALATSALVDEEK